MQICLKNYGMVTDNIFMFTEKTKGIEKLEEIIQENDNILVKASNFMGFKEIIEKIIIQS